MSEQPNSGAAQFRADVPSKIEQGAIEQEAVRTTIVGGRPPGSGQPIGSVPRGIEVLLKKAVVDPEFRKLLLDDPNKAATSIGLELEPVESAMLQTFPKEHLTAIIDKTEVPQTQRRAFLGHTAALMLTVLGGATFVAGCPKGCIPGSIVPRTPMPFPPHHNDPEGEPAVIDESRYAPAPAGIRPDVSEEEATDMNKSEPEPLPEFRFSAGLLR